MKSFDYDVVIIGGGIQGAGVAQAASAAGYQVLVLEKQEVAAGTSSKSSKLIHGGLRYLESLNFPLVKECLKERALLLKNAPDLVQMERFYIPVYRHSKRAPWKIRLGLYLYHALGGFDQKYKPGELTPREWGQLDGLSREALLAVFYYYDARTDDRKLTQSVMASAQELGATVLTEAEFVGAELLREGCEVDYCYRGHIERCRSRTLVNASGPWVQLVADKIHSGPPRPSVDLVGGTHIEVPGHLACGVYYVESPEDGRPVFVMPWQDHILVGTTERLFHGVPEALQPTEEEKTYLLTTLQHYFPDFQHLSDGDILAAWSGLRVLPQGQQGLLSRSREVIYQCDRDQQPRLLSLYGGKLTAYRATAERTLEKLRPSLPPTNPAANTLALRLHPQG